MARNFGPIARVKEFIFHSVNNIVTLQNLFKQGDCVVSFVFCEITYLLGHEKQIRK